MVGCLDVTEFSDPALTVVCQPGYQLGRTAARLLLSRISGDEGSPRKIVLATDLKIRNSVSSVTPKRPGGRSVSRMHKVVTSKRHIVRV